MASGDNEHRMLFDLRGKRRNVVKVVYATLAVLMGLSLFLVIGGFNIAELFSDETSSGDASKPYEEQAERIEAKLAKDPKNPDLLMTLTRARINAGNGQVTIDETTGQQQVTPEAGERYEEAYQSWSEYLEVTKEPSAGLALVVAPMLSQLTELSRTYGQIDTRIQAAVEAQRIVAEQRPSVNSFSTLAFYTYFTGDYKAAEEARAEAKKLAGTKAERESIDKQLDELKKNSERFFKEREAAEKQQAKAGGNQGGSAGNLKDPFGGLGGGLGE